MQDDYSNQKKKISIFLCSSFIFVISIIVISVILKSIHNNPYGKEIPISNFTKYFQNVPQDTKDSLFHSLYNFATNNQDNTLNKENALIREGTTGLSYDTIKNLYTGSAIVDIDNAQLSFKVLFYWSEDKNNEYLNGNIAYVICPPKEYIIYNSQECNNNEEDDVNSFLDNYPIIRSLPIEVEYYSNNYTEYTKYSIYYSLDNFDSEKEKKLTLLINDYSGNSYKKALESIKIRNYNPEDYIIQYIDYTKEN